MRMAIASDHAAVSMKAALIVWPGGQGCDVDVLDTDGEARIDYPDFGYKLAAHVAAGNAERGVALSGTGIGISIAVNRNPNVRCALVSEPVSAGLAREHTDANVIAMGARVIGAEMAQACLVAVLTTPLGCGRHARRVRKRWQLTSERVRHE